VKAASTLVPTAMPRMLVTKIYSAVIWPRIWFGVMTTNDTAITPR